MKTNKRNLKAVFASLALAGAFAATSLLTSPIVSANTNQSPTPVVCTDGNCSDTADFDYKTLTADEKAQVKAAYDKADPIFNELFKLYDDQGNVTDQAKATELEKQIDDIFRPISAIEDKMAKEDESLEKADMEAYLKEAKGLSDQEKATYKANAETIASLEKEVDALYDDNGKATDANKAKDLEAQLEKAYASLADLEDKVFNAELESSTALTKDEKAKLKAGYAEIEELQKAYDAIMTEDGGVKDEAKAKELDKALETAFASVSELEGKLGGDCN